MKPTALLIILAIKLSASEIFTVIPHGMLLKLPGHEQLVVVAEGARLVKVEFTIQGVVMTVPKEELGDLPPFFIDSVRYVKKPLSSRREVLFEAGERADLSVNPPILPKIIKVRLYFDDGAYTGRMTETPTDDLTYRIRMKDAGEPEKLGATVTMDPPIPFQQHREPIKKPNRVPGSD